jgi:hypothetical protein
MFLFVASGRELKRYCRSKFVSQPSLLHIFQISTSNFSPSKQPALSRCIRFCMHRVSSQIEQRENMHTVVRWKEDSSTRTERFCRVSDRFDVFRQAADYGDENGLHVPNNTPPTSPVLCNSGGASTTTVLIISSSYCTLLPQTSTVEVDGWSIAGTGSSKSMGLQWCRFQPPSQTNMRV